ncbi:uncharacterized protein MYCGRDRAFT_91742 [Zymoseptoria tritici IPO323]|uniref:Uncharacterized protein n=1 Tax=Zymoseptoria tritici (strain CBS 115943 / IPO323) TaxID=336722 RepID=F9X5N1_ZYMTI|nr:uncharacterized protein MYCGRDRAFT_91742 [Zymoseptoria tritici IPO323]EGP89379.1 hypothetical protein MYCGRDRAFT_91742 [Zymoseptoria tritici IPO323]
MTPSMQQLVDLDHSAQQEQVGDGKHTGHAKDHGPLRSEGKAGVTKLSSSLGARTQARPLSTIFETVRTSTCYTQPLSPGSTPPDVDYSTKPDLEQYLSRKPEPRRKVSPSAAWRELDGTDVGKRTRKEQRKCHANAAT